MDVYSHELIYFPYINNDRRGHQRGVVDMTVPAVLHGPAGAYVLHPGAYVLHPGAYVRPTVLQHLAPVHRIPQTSFKCTVALLQVRKTGLIFR